MAADLLDLARLAFLRMLANRLDLTAGQALCHDACGQVPRAVLTNDLAVERQLIAGGNPDRAGTLAHDAQDRLGQSQQRQRLVNRAG